MKRKINLVLLICFMISMMMIYAASNVYACSCIEPLTVEEELDRSEAVFTGRVLEVKDIKNLNGYMTKSALFEVSQIWKGGSESQIIIYTGGGGGDCGYHFEEGKEYLVYANLSTMYGDKEQLVSIMCDRTNVLAQAQDDLAILGEGKVPTEQVNLEKDSAILGEGKVATEQVSLNEKVKATQLYVWAIVVGIVVLGMIFFFVWRKRRK
ncbi:hypothetical protein [Paenibacillus endoradicis]|uniref:hypothetical protein n=1 Tax=Paenibacillus endoradicis TaxID=2972487 RepID=UPI0021592B12|nr:hypothetical protein [Paenibacillus endoradicis]MCR8658792.1 hypothetical protein [Paenibacillus endoradicis]